MIPDSPFTEPVSSFQAPIANPGVAPNAAPIEIVVVNSTWLAILRGCAKQLLQPTTWRTSDPDEQQLLQEQALDLIDLLQDTEGAALIPTGTIVLFATTSTTPKGWLLCDGDAVDRVHYANLFARIGEQFGPGDGETTFNLPDLRGRFPLGVGPGPGPIDYGMGGQGGEQFHTLTDAEMPAHDHHTYYADTWSPVQVAGGSTAYAPDGAGSTIPIQTNVAGSGDEHNNMPPFLALDYLIKT